MAEPSQLGGGFAFSDKPVNVDQEHDRTGAYPANTPVISWALLTTAIFCGGKSSVEVFNSTVAKGNQ